MVKPRDVVRLVSNAGCFFTGAIEKLDSEVAVVRGRFHKHDGVDNPRTCEVVIRVPVKFMELDERGV